MNIVVPVKQVPESSNVKMDRETGTIIRSGAETVVNPLDFYALEAALRLKERYTGTVTAVSMGPQQAVRALREAAAMGCDAAMLLSDRRFSGADTWATSYTLAKGIEKNGAFDLIITGERATDGDTAQVGPGLASWLNIPVLTYVSNIEKIENNRIYLERLVEEGYQSVSAPLPCLITVVKEIAVPRLPRLQGKIRSMDMQIPVYGADDLDIDANCIGLKGSPTRVVTIDTPKLARSGTVITAQDEEGIAFAVKRLMALFEEKGLTGIRYGR